MDVQHATKENMHTLTKHGPSGFTKRFYTETHLRNVLQKLICQRCLDEYGTSLKGMQHSDCGINYKVTADVEDTREGQLYYYEWA